MRLDVAGGSDLGLVRRNNEDAWLAGESLGVVADGVGGRPAGEVASLIAVQAFSELAGQGVDLTAAARGVSRLVHAVGEGNPLFTGMCCTLTAVTVRLDGLWLTQIGDSKAWLVRDGQAKQVSEEQTLVAQLVASGELTQEQARSDPRRNRILQAIGSARELEPQVVRLDVQVGDRLVLATDGLDYATPDEALLGKAVSPGELVELLLAATLEAGAPDNVTVVVADLLA